MENTRGININDKSYLIFELNNNEYCCGQYIMGNIELYNNVSSSVVNKYPTWEKFINSIIGDDYSDTRTSIICTVVNESIYDTLTKFGFKLLSEFKNCKTGNTVMNLEYIIKHGYTYNEEDDY